MAYIVWGCPTFITYIYWWPTLYGDVPLLLLTFTDGLHCMGMPHFCYLHLLMVYIVWGCPTFVTYIYWWPTLYGDVPLLLLTFTDGLHCMGMPHFCYLHLLMVYIVWRCPTFVTYIYWWPTLYGDAPLLLLTFTDGLHCMGMSHFTDGLHCKGMPHFCYLHLLTAYIVWGCPTFVTYIYWWPTLYGDAPLCYLHLLMAYIVWGCPILLLTFTDGLHCMGMPHFCYLHLLMAYIVWGCPTFVTFIYWLPTLYGDAPFLCRALVAFLMIFILFVNSRSKSPPSPGVGSDIERCITSRAELVLLARSLGLSGTLRQDWVLSRWTGPTRPDGDC